MYAIIECDGKQHKVTSGQVLNLDIQGSPDEKTVTFDRVLLVGGGEGAAQIGTPLVAGASVTAEVLGPIKGPKVDIYKHRRRKGYRRHTGHRQKYLQVRIGEIKGQ